MAEFEYGQVNLCGGGVNELCLTWWRSPAVAPSPSSTSGQPLNASEHTPETQKHTKKKSMMDDEKKMEGEDAGGAWRRAQRTTAPHPPNWWWRGLVLHVSHV